MPSSLDIDYIFKSMGGILAYLPVTLRLALIPMILGSLLGLVIALIRIYRIPVLNQVAAAYVSFIRGTPTLVQLFLVYYGLPWTIASIGAVFDSSFSYDFNLIPPEAFALLTFTINTSAYASETLRSAIESVDRGQLEAAESIGLRTRQVMLRIVFPQAALNALPNLSNSLISLVKDSSLAFMIMVIDVMGMAKIIGSRSLRFLEAYFSVSIIYWIVCILIELAFKLLERRLSISRRGLAE